MEFTITKYILRMLDHHVVKEKKNKEELHNLSLFICFL